MGVNVAMFFIDNQNKDLTEVRDKDTGILLGWMPTRVSLEPYINFAVPPSLPRSVMATAGKSAIDYSKVRFDYDPLYFGTNVVRSYKVSREEWEKLVRNP
jgi:hypothetical protein